jgi:hypothetical protein
VRCRTAATQWKRGVVTKLHYREDDWPPGRVVPYQIQLDVGTLIYAPQDDDGLLQADNGTEEREYRAYVHVCQAGPCRRAGGEAVLLEIEELANNVGGVVVQRSGCLGNCSQAPNALVVAGQSERVFARLCNLSATAGLVEHASGRAPSLEDSDMIAQLQRARQLRVRMEAREQSKWNLALAGLAEDAEHAKSEDDRVELVQERAELLVSAGFGDKALEVLSTVASFDELSLEDIPTLRLLLDTAKILAQLGRVPEIEAFRARVDQLQPGDSRESSIKGQVVELLVGMIVEVPIDRVNATDVRIQDYVRWSLHSVTPVSKHSAVYHFQTDDGSRGTPIRKGRGGRTVWSKTWYTTMLAEVGAKRNKEGPLPWIERDYTPISTAHDWERGQCDILIKVYLEPPGMATEWLHRVSTSSSAGDAATEAEESASRPTPSVWLSRPMKTLHVPSLASDDQCINRKHASVLLLVAGTGVVTVPQVLHHANSKTCFGPRVPITQPVTAIYSCRSDDALLIPEMARLCLDGSLTRCMVLVTPSQAVTTPFPDVADTDIEAAFSQLDNAVCINARLSLALLQAEMNHLQKPVRVVVSGPESFNAACKCMLKQIDLDLEAEGVTILSA